MEKHKAINQKRLQQGNQPSKEEGKQTIRACTFPFAARELHTSLVLHCCLNIERKKLSFLRLFDSFLLQTEVKIIPYFTALKKDHSYAF